MAVASKNSSSAVAAALAAAQAQLQQVLASTIPTASPATITASATTTTATTKILGGGETIPRGGGATGPGTGNICQIDIVLCACGDVL